ncbi:hypothetical protein D3C76_1278720 [compost metagenome]
MANPMPTSTIKAAASDTVHFQRNVSKRNARRRQPIHLTRCRRLRRIRSEGTASDHGSRPCAEGGAACFSRCDSANSGCAVMTCAGPGSPAPGIVDMSGMSGSNSFSPLIPKTFSQYVFCSRHTVQVSRCFAISERFASVSVPSSQSIHSCSEYIRTHTRSYSVPSILR